MKDSLKKTGYVLLPILVYYVVSSIFRIFLMYILQLTVSGRVEVFDFIQSHSDIFAGCISIICQSAGAVALIFLMRKDIWELSVWDYLNLNGISFYRKDRYTPAWISWLLIGIGGISLGIGINIILYLSGLTEASAEYETTASNQYAVPIWLGIILYGIVSPFVEELLYRVIVYGRLKRSFPYIIAVIASSLFFGITHGNIVQGIYGFIMGIFMCVACEYVHTVFGALFVHSLVNLCIFFLGYYGFLSGLGNTKACITALSTAFLSIMLAIVFSIKSYKKYGKTAGVTFVGCFYSE